MKSTLRAFVAAALVSVAVGGCDSPADNVRDSTPDEDTPGAENRAAGIKRDDVTPLPGTRPEGGQDPTELRDRIPPDDE